MNASTTAGATVSKFTTLSAKFILEVRSTSGEIAVWLREWLKEQQANWEDLFDHVT
jgi:hypothetical protein